MAIGHSDRPEGDFNARTPPPHALVSTHCSVPIERLRALERLADLALEWQYAHRCDNGPACQRAERTSALYDLIISRGEPIITPGLSTEKEHPNG